MRLHVPRLAEATIMDFCVLAGMVILVIGFLERVAR